MPTHHDETLQQRYAREHQDYLKLCGSMTAEQVAGLQLQLNNALGREAALQARLEQKRIEIIDESTKAIESYGKVSDMQRRMDVACDLLHIASMKLADRLTFKESPRAEIIAFLSQSTEAADPMTHGPHTLRSAS